MPFEHGGQVDQKREADSDESSSSATKAGPTVDKTVEAMDLARKLRCALDDGQAANHRSAGAPYRLTKRQVSRFLRLVRLPEDIQDAILAGRAVGLSVNSLVALVDLEDVDRQRTELSRLAAQAADRPDRRRTRPPNRRLAKEDQADDVPVSVRAVLYFNPEIFVAQRLAAQRARENIETSVADINKSIATPQSNRSEQVIIADVHALLRKHHLVGVFEYAVKQHRVGARSRYQVELTFKPKEWKRRRQYDGFSVLVGHPKLRGTPAELVALYRSKDTIETDFHVIKSLIELRPLRHRTDPKIRAHVTICMLGLLLERTLRKKLAAVNARHSSARALNALKSCHLNFYQVAPNMPGAYRITQVDDSQAAILRALRLKRLADDQELVDRISPPLTPLYLPRSGKPA